MVNIINASGIKKTKEFHAGMLVAISGILYGFMGYFGTHILGETESVPTMLFWRFFIAGCWMSIFSFRKDISVKQHGANNKTFLLLVLIAGALFYSGGSAFYFFSSQSIGTGLAMVIFFSYPIFITLRSLILCRNKISALTFSALMFIIIGMFLLHNPSQGQLNLLGICWGIIAAICYALYIMGSKKVSTFNISPTLLTTFISFGCAMCFLVIALSSNSFSFPHTTKNWGYLIMLGVVSTALPMQLMLKGLREISSLRASIISALEPIVTVIVGIMFLDEFISLTQFLGILVILISAIAVQFQKEL
jgi:drug/metabolite transporter (DMT)-like permease